MDSSQSNTDNSQRDNPAEEQEEPPDLKVQETHTRLHRESINLISQECTPPGLLHPMATLMATAEGAMDTEDEHIHGNPSMGTHQWGTINDRLSKTNHKDPASFLAKQ